METSPGERPSSARAIRPRRRRPERVLNPDQTRAFDQGMWGPRELVVVDADGAFIGRMRVEAAGAVKAAFAPSSAEAVRSEFGQ